MSSPTTGAINAVAQNLWPLIQKIQDLRHSGHSITLPKICVVGDQIAGKRSLLESIARIELPQIELPQEGPGCPFEFNLRESEEAWTCTIYLSRKFKFDQPPQESPLQTKQSQWRVQNAGDQHFITLRNKADTREAIRWAQAATLNPDKPLADYLYVPGRNQPVPSWQVKFSPNIVRLDISGPDVPTLSLYHLPSVVAAANVGDRKSVHTAVEKLIRTYISHESSIVLLVLPMVYDRIHRDAVRILGCARERTLGVMTEPNGNQSEESYTRWIQDLSRDQLWVGHEFFILGRLAVPDWTSDEEATIIATRPWATNLPSYRFQCGIRRLQATLSGLLLGQVQQYLPHITERLKQEAAQTNEELEDLPQPSLTGAQYILCECIQALKDQLRAHFVEHSSLWKIWNNTATDFEKALISTRPTTQLPVIQETSRDVAPQQDSEFETVTGPETRPDSRRKRRALASPAANPRPAKLSAQEYSTDCFKQYKSPARTFYWQEIREMNVRSSLLGMPDQPDLSVIEEMRRLSVQHWNRPMATFLDETHRLVRNTVYGDLESVFHRYDHTNLYRELKQIVHDYLLGIERASMQRSQEIYNADSRTPFTIQLQTLEHETKKWLRCLSDRCGEGTNVDPGGPELRIMAVCTQSLVQCCQECVD